MDAGQFDRLARTLSTTTSRRGTLTALLGGLTAALVTRAAPEVASGKSKGSGNARGKGRARGRKPARDDRAGKRGKHPKRQSAHAESACYPGTSCTPAPGANLAKCDFGGTNALRGANVRGANFKNANLRKADTTGATFAGANLSGACLVDANLRDANLGNAGISGVIRCRTTMPDGRIDNSGCASATSCCPTCAAVGEACGGALGGGCCGSAECQNGRCTCPATKPNLCNGSCNACCGDTDCREASKSHCCNGICKGCCSDTQCAGGICFQNTCCTPETRDVTCAGGRCGRVTNNCGQSVACGACPEQICRTGTCTAERRCAYSVQADRTECLTESGANPGICCSGECRAGDCCSDGDCGARGNQCVGNRCACGNSAACQEPTETCCGNAGSPSCIDTTTDVANCGRCGKRCPEAICQVTTCANGTCGLGNASDGPAADCPAPGCCNGACCAGADVCHNGACCTPLLTCAPDRCGTIDDGCGGSLDCGSCQTPICQVGTCGADGVCTFAAVADGTTCGTGSICCGGACVSGVCCATRDCPTQSSNQCIGNHCQCGPSDPCPGSALHCCGDGDTAVCATVSRDPDNCGACGRICPADTCEQAICANSRCDTVPMHDRTGPSCDGPGALCCDGHCIDTTTNDNHCGGCDQQCGTFTACSGGACACPCSDFACQVAIWGSPGTGDGQFDSPRGAAVAANGRVYVTDNDNHRVQVFTADGTFLFAWGSQGSGDGQFNQPRGIAIAKDGTVYVADRGNNRIQYFAADGSFRGRWGQDGPLIADGEFNNPTGVAVAPNGNVYVADTNDDRIQYFTATGTFLGKWGRFGEQDGEFELPSGVAVAPDGRVYVADTFNDRIQWFTATGTFLGKRGAPHFSGTDANNQYLRPRGIAVDANGNVFVADSGNSRITAIGPVQQFLGKWGSNGNPEGVTVAPDGTVYVAETGNNKVKGYCVTLA